MELNNNFKYVKEKNIIKYYWKCKGDDPIVRGKYLPYICSHIHHGPAFYLRFSGLKGHWHEIFRLCCESYPIAFQICRNRLLFDECSTHLQRNLAILHCGLQRRIGFSPWNPSRNKNPLCGPHSALQPSARGHLHSWIIRRIRNRMFKTTLNWVIRLVRKSSAWYPLKG